MARILSRFSAAGLSRRSFLLSAAAFAAGLSAGDIAAAAQSPAFARWVANFRPRAVSRDISEQTYDRVMGALTPDTSVYAQFNSQPEVTELMWQYINRRCSEWRVTTGKEPSGSPAAPFSRRPGRTPRWSAAYTWASSKACSLSPAPTRARQIFIRSPSPAPAC